MDFWEAMDEAGGPEMGPGLPDVGRRGTRVVVPGAEASAAVGEFPPMFHKPEDVEEKLPPGRDPIKRFQGGGSPKLDYKVHVRRFNFDNKEDIAAYEKVMQDILTGDFQMRKEEWTPTPQGGMVATLFWFSAKPRKPKETPDKNGSKVKRGE